MQEIVQKIYKNTQTKIKLIFPHYIIMILILLDPNMLMLGLYDYQNISVANFFKPWDLFIVILLAYYFIKSEKKIIWKNVLLSKEIKYLIIFYVFYILYTILYSKTSGLLDTIRVGRNGLFIFMYFIFYNYIDKNIILIFWKFILLLLRISFVLTMLHYLKIISLSGISFDNGVGALRGFPFDSNYVLLLFLFGIIQYIIGYKKEYKISKYDFGISVFYILVSYTRGYWFAAIIALLFLAVILFTIKNRFISFTKQMRFALLIIAVSILTMGSMYYTQSTDIFIERFFSAEEDIQSGEMTGSFATRLDNLDNSMFYVKQLGMQYTGTGFMHGYNSQLAVYYVSVLGYWGSEMGIGMNLLQYGYIGVAIFYLLWLLLILKIFRTSVKSRNANVFIFGLALSIFLFVMNFIASWSSTSLNNIINVAVILAIYSRIYEKSKQIT